MAVGRSPSKTACGPTHLVHSTNCGYRVLSDESVSGLVRPCRIATRSRTFGGAAFECRDVAAARASAPALRIRRLDSVPQLPSRKALQLCHDHVDVRRRIVRPFRVQHERRYPHARGGVVGRKGEERGEKGRKTSEPLPKTAYESRQFFSGRFSSRFSIRSSLSRNSRGSSARTS